MYNPNTAILRELLLDGIFTNASILINSPSVYSIIKVRNHLLENNNLYKEDFTCLIKKDAFEIICALDIRDHFII